VIPLSSADRKGRKRMRMNTAAHCLLVLMFVGGCSDKSPNSDLKRTLDVVFQQTSSIQTEVWKATKPSYVLYDFNRTKVVGILNTAPVLHIGDLIAWDDDDL
jgi:hypothetical protein